MILIFFIFYFYFTWKIFYVYIITVCTYTLNNAVTNQHSNNAVTRVQTSFLQKSSRPIILLFILISNSSIPADINNEGIIERDTLNGRQPDRGHTRLRRRNKLQMGFFFLTFYHSKNKLYQFEIGFRYCFGTMPRCPAKCIRCVALKPNK